MLAIGLETLNRFLVSVDIIIAEQRLTTGGDDDDR